MDGLFDSSNSPPLSAATLKKLAHADPLKLKAEKKSFYSIQNPESFCYSEAATTVEAESPAPISPSHPIHNEWEDIAVRLSESSSPMELMQLLQYTKRYLQNLVNRNESRRQAMPADETDIVVKQVGAKFCDIISSQQKRGVSWNHDLERVSWSIRLEFFDFNRLRMLPSELIQEIFLWLPVSSFVDLACVCSEWNRLCLSDNVWSQLYTRKYLISNPGPLPERGVMPMRDCFCERLKTPELGDKVEVAWKGKFRLETNDVYQGLAWWRAEIVDRHTAQKRYKIHYPGWESRWDEWVPSSRLRWMAETNDKEAISVGDVVEVWCCGVNVPGAWLESKVKKVKADMYCLGKVTSNGNLWVERERLRLVRKASQESEAEVPSTPVLDAPESTNSTPAPSAPVAGLLLALATRVEQFFYGSNE